MHPPLCFIKQARQVMECFWPFCLPSLLVQELVFYMHNKHLYVVIWSNTFGKHKTNKAKVTVCGRPAGVYIVGLKILWYNIQTLRGSGAYMISLKSSLFRWLLPLWTWAERPSVFLYFDSKAESSSEEDGNSDQERVAETLLSKDSAFPYLWAFLLAWAETGLRNVCALFSLAFSGHSLPPSFNNPANHPYTQALLCAKPCNEHVNFF